MIDFSTLRGLTIPEGVVTKIESGGVVLWNANTIKVVYNLGVLNFSYLSFLKFYSVTTYANTPPDETNLPNAIKIDDEVISTPVVNNMEKQIDLGASFPDEANKFSITLLKNVSSNGLYQVTIRSIEDVSGKEISLIII
jgi:hypothetical protein